jgi:hypothetical protein
LVRAIVRIPQQGNQGLLVEQLAMLFGKEAILVRDICQEMGKFPTL